MRAEAFDVVLLDIMMPDMNGYEVLEVLKHDSALRHVPVIMITAIDDMQSVVRCIEMGAEDHLPKPFNPALLRARIDASLARKRLRDREQVYAQSLERELEIARTIQSSFLPDRLPDVAGWEMAVSFRPARQVAGDFYDVFTIPGSDRLAVVVADVCGKGVGAAVFMAAFRTVIRALTEHTFAVPSDAKDELLRLVDFVNAYVSTTHARSNMFATLFFAVLEPSTGALAYVDAGHDPPIVRRVDGRLERLDPTGPAVGLLPGLPFGVARVMLDVGDTLLVYTDGVPDARNEADAPLTEARLLSVVQASDAATSSALIVGIEAAMSAHAGAAEQFDDVTLLALRRTQASSE
jgi:serine phosphatase RsbU (regulator of sigma subunit)